MDSRRVVEDTLRKSFLLGIANEERLGEKVSLSLIGVSKWLELSANYSFVR